MFVAYESREKILHFFADLDEESEFLISPDCFRSDIFSKIHGTLRDSRPFYSIMDWLSSLQVVRFINFSPIDGANLPHDLGPKLVNRCTNFLHSLLEDEGKRFLDLIEETVVVFIWKNRIKVPFGVGR